MSAREVLDGLVSFSRQKTMRGEPYHGFWQTQDGCLVTYLAGHVRDDEGFPLEVVVKFPLDLSIEELDEALASYQLRLKCPEQSGHEQQYHVLPLMRRPMGDYCPIGTDHRITFERVE